MTGVQTCALPILGPDLRPFAFPAPAMEDETGAALEEPRKPGMTFRMRLPRAVPPDTILRVQAGEEP